MQLIKRALTFKVFADIVMKHIANYTFPQYGDAPDDEVETWTPAQCVKAISKYKERFESNRRGRLETLRDMVKITHFAELTFWKLKPTKEEITKIEKGEG